jgi:DNA-binding transcriptional ArsR family regulator
VPAHRPGAWFALGDPTRKAIFELLLDRPRGVAELAGELSVGPPEVSEHLEVLKYAGLVIDQPVGDRRVYRVAPDGLETLQADLERSWTQVLTAYRAAAEKSTEDDR